MTARLEQARDRDAFLAARRRAQEPVSAPAGAKKAATFNGRGVIIAERPLPKQAHVDHPLNRR